MSQFLTTVEKYNSKFIGFVRDSNTHQVLFRSNELETEELVLNEVNQFISTFKTNSSNSTTTTEIPTPPIESAPPRRCCGR